jgi:hypothetical protein
MNAFWASENFDAFIVFRSSQPRNAWRGKFYPKTIPISGIRTNEDEQVQRGPDHRRAARARSWQLDRGGLPAARDPISIPNCLAGMFALSEDGTQ